MWFTFPVEFVYNKNITKEEPSVEMYYEQYRKKGRKPPPEERLSPGGWLISLLLRLVALTAAIALLAGALLYVLPPSMFAVEPEGANLSLTDGLPMDVINVLLLGTDVENSGIQRSDAMLIASIGFGKFKLTSVIRDTLVNIPGHGQNKLNAAYAYGGPELVMRTINETFGLNLMHYAQVDFAALAAVVDAIGGVVIPEISQGEMEYINENTRKSGKVFAPLGYVPQELTRYGQNIRLDGLQALSYARIRKIGNDYGRAERQRTVINAIVERVRANLWNPVMISRLLKAVMASVNTNMSALQVMSLGEKALMVGRAETFQLPVKGAYTDDGSKIILDNRTACRDAFIRFVYN